MKFIPVLITIVFILLILMSLGCSCMNDPKGYNKNNMFSNEFPYENFESLNPANFNRPEISGNVKLQKIEGFQGLLSSPYINVTKNIDIFSQAKGNAQCVSGPYSNSTGYLCLDKEQKKMLSTRGGNSSGRDSEIGPQ